MLAVARAILVLSWIFAFAAFAEAEGAPQPASDVPADATAAPAASTTSRVGEVVPLTQRDPMTTPWGLMLGFRYGLVGSGPTRLVTDIRLGITPWLEARTSLAPYPSSLMLRGAIGDRRGTLGLLLIDGGLAHFDAGVRLVPDTGEANVGVRFHFEGGLAYKKTLNDRVSVYAQTHYRYRWSPFLSDDDQHVVFGDAHAAFDITKALSFAGGVGAATTLWTPVRDLALNPVETDQPGISHLLARDEGSTWSVTLPMSLTYARVENFDVDLFCTPRVLPELGVLVGAGVRLRLDPLWTYFGG